jgi:O-antigen/teichoic acid export membrane protein
MSWYVMAYAGTGIAQKGFGFLLALWLARTLTKEEYAKFGLLFALQSGLTAFAMAGIVEVVISLLGRRKGHERRAGLFRAANTLFAVLSLLTAAVSAILYWFYLRHSGVRWLPFVCVLLGALVAAHFLLQSNFVRLEERHGAALVFGFLAPMAGLVGAASAFLLQASVDSYFLGSVGASVLVLIALRFVGFGSHGLSKSRSEVRPMRLSIAPYIGVTALGWVSGYGNVWVVESMFPARLVAEFAFAYTLSSVLQLAANAMNQVWSPHFFKIVNSAEPADTERQNMRFYRFQGLALGAVAAVMVFGLPYLLKFAGGNLAGYDVAGGVAWLFAGYAVTIPWWHAQNYFLIKGEGKRLMRIVLSTTAVGMAAWVGAMALFGAAGIYVGFFLLMLFRSTGICIVARRLWGISIAWQGASIACALIAVSSLLGK